MQRLLIALAIFGATLFAYAGVRHGEFLEFDDPQYVSRNQVVQQGLTGEGVRWALTATAVSNWHPLTWLSHMADVQLFGLDAGRHHLANAVLHATNAALLFWVLLQLTGAPVPSALAAALFALHPAHVESVAWISERKDTLSTLLGLLSLGAWVRYARDGRRSGYVLALLAFAASLCAKPMLVTLPFALLLLDVWPLRRLREVGALGARVLEKVPFLALSAGSSAITYVVQSGGGSVYTHEGLSLLDRISNAAVAYARYLGAAAWPHELAPFYPHPGAWPLGVIAGAILLLGALTALALWQLRRRPWLAVGWFWFAGTLVPVSGVVQVGLQSMADRYTYVPFIGLYVALAWSGWDAARRRSALRLPLALAALAVLVLLGAATRLQVAHWRTPEALWAHTLSADPSNAFAHNQYGAAIGGRGGGEEAIEHFREAIRLNPTFSRAHVNLGTALLGRGELRASIESYRRGAELSPRAALARRNLGLALARQGDWASAAAELEQSLALEPGSSDARFSLAIALENLGRPDEAEAQLTTLIEHDPGHGRAHSRLGMLALQRGALDTAGPLLARARELDPGVWQTHYALGSLAYRQSGIGAARSHWERALGLAPDEPLVLLWLSWGLATAADPSQRDGDQALALAERLCARSGCRTPGELDALAAAQAAAGRFAAAADTATGAARIARDVGQGRLADGITARAKLYRAGRGYRVERETGEDQSIPK